MESMKENVGIEYISLENSPVEGFHRSLITTYGEFVFVDGLQSRLYDGDISAQAEDVLSYLAQCLRQVGADWTSVLRVEVTLRSMADFAAMNHVWNRHIVFDAPPGRACLSADLFPSKALIQVSAFAVKQEVTVGPGETPSAVSR